MMSCAQYLYFAFFAWVRERWLLGKRRRQREETDSELPPMWDGDGAWREEAEVLLLGDLEDTCGRLLAAAQQTNKKKNNKGGGGQMSMLAGEVSRLERALGPAAAATAVAQCRDASGRTATMRASRSGDLDGVDACVRARCGGGESTSEATSVADFIADGDNHGVSALALAAWQGHTHVVDYLLRRGADANRRDDFGVAALHKAVGHGHLTAALRLLGDGGTDPNLRVGSISDRIPEDYRAVSRHQTALHIACYRRQADGSQAPGDARMVRGDRCMCMWGVSGEGCGGLWGVMGCWGRVVELSLTRMCLEINLGSHVFFFLKCIARSLAAKRDVIAMLLYNNVTLRAALLLVPVQSSH